MGEEGSLGGETGRVVCGDWGRGLGRKTRAPAEAPAAVARVDLLGGIGQER